MTDPIAYIQDLVTGGRLGRNLAEPVDFEATATRVVTYAAALAGDPAAALVQPTSEGRARVEAVTGPEWADTFATALRTDNQELWSDAGPVAVDDIHTGTRWPAVSARLRLLTPVRSVLGLRLQLSGRYDGILVLADEQPGHFTADRQHLMSGFADHAVVALAAAFEHRRADNLAAAVLTNRTIGQAIGILMTTAKITEPAAFELLVRSSQSTHAKLARVAEVVVLTGALPAEATDVVVLAPRTPQPTVTLPAVNGTRLGAVAH